MVFKAFYSKWIIVIILGMIYPYSWLHKYVATHIELTIFKSFPNYSYDCQLPFFYDLSLVKSLFTHTSILSSLINLYEVLECEV